MGVTRTAPWWLTWVFLAGLVALFVGERVLDMVGPARAVLSGLGTLVVLGCIVWRAISRAAASAAAESVERLLLIAYVGCLAALALYFVSSADGMRWLGIELARDEVQNRYEVALRVLWPIVLAASLLPALGAQLAIGAHRHAHTAGAGLEALRVAGTAQSALAVALAGALLFVVGWIGSARDQTLDVSYFRTSSPGTATIAMAEGLSEPLHVTLFFPDVNRVKDEALGYFRALAGEAGRVEIETYDRLAAPALAEEHRVTQDGTVLLSSGQGEERIVVGAELADARSQLRTLDGAVQQRLMMLLRERRTVYLTTGHGEVNDTASAGPLATERLGGTDALRQLLGLLNYDVRDLGLASGLGQAVPDDAALVMVLGPRRPFLPEELATLDRYLAGGGSLLLALDPGSEFSLGRLERRLGVRFVGDVLADDQRHLRQRGNLSDRRLIIASRFSSHAAVTTPSRSGFGSAVLFVGAGYLEPITNAPEPSFIVHSLPSTFADRDGDFTFDEGVEQRQPYNLVAAVEAEHGGPPADVPADRLPVRVAAAASAGGAEGRTPADAAVPATATKSAPAAEERGLAPSDSMPAPAAEATAPTARGPAAASQDSADAGPPMRALVYADAGLFTDAVIGTLGLNAAFVADGIKWLGGEEALAGIAESEEDVPIVHTQAEDVIWFYSTILGAPALVLALGLFLSYRRRRRSGGVANAPGVPA